MFFQVHLNVFGIKVILYMASHITALFAE